MVTVSFAYRTFSALRNRFGKGSSKGASKSSLQDSARIESKEIRTYVLRCTDRSIVSLMGEMQSCLWIVHFAIALSTVPRMST